MLHLFSTSIFMLTVLPSLLTACLHPSRSLTVQGFLLLFIPFLSIFLMQELTSIFTLSSLTLVNSETLFLRLFFHLSMTWTLPKEEFKDTSQALNWSSTPCLYFSYCPLYRIWQQVEFFLTYFCLPLWCWKKKFNNKVQSCNYVESTIQFVSNTGKNNNNFLLEVTTIINDIFLLHNNAPGSK